MTRARLAAIGLVVGCAASRPPPPPPPAPLPVSPAGVDRAVIGHDLATIESLADRACACRDDACRDGVDADLVAYAQVVTDNDPLTDVETWPRDLDDLSHAATMRLFACFGEHHRIPGFFQALMVRRSLDLAHASCACSDRACADLAGKRLRRDLGEHVRLDAEQQTSVNAARVETERCIAQVEGQAALLDLKEIRKDACACQDGACVADAGKRFDAWRAENERTKADDQTIRSIRDVAQELGACLRGARSP